MKGVVPHLVDGARKYHLSKWKVVCIPKDQGCLGIPDLEKMNISLMCKWLLRLCNEDGMWQQVFRNKYLASQTLSAAKYKVGYSQFWSGLMKVKDLFTSCSNMIVGNGNQIRFWEDSWMGNKPLCFQFPRLYDISFSKNISVAEVF